MYLKLIGMLGYHGQRMVEHCLEPHNPMMEVLLIRLKRDGFERGEATAQDLENIGKRYFGFIDRLSRSIPEARKQVEDDMQKLVDGVSNPR